VILDRKHSNVCMCVQSTKANDPGKVKRKFSSFFKSLVIELNKDLYGPDNHLVEVTADSYSQHIAAYYSQHSCKAVIRSSHDSVVN